MQQAYSIISHINHEPFYHPLAPSTPRRLFFTPWGQWDTILNPFSRCFQPCFDPTRHTPKNGPKVTSAAGNRGILGLKPHLEAFKTSFVPPKNYVWAARVLKLPQVLNFGSKHRENMPATARGSSQSSRARETSKLSHFTILWCQVRVGRRLFFTREWTCRWPKKSWTT